MYIHVRFIDCTYFRKLGHRGIHTCVYVYIHVHVHVSVVREICSGTAIRTVHDADLQVNEGHIHVYIRTCTCASPCEKRAL